VGGGGVRLAGRCPVRTLQWGLEDASGRVADTEFQRAALTVIWGPTMREVSVPGIGVGGFPQLC
jgi:hypothetical protein